VVLGNGLGPHRPLSQEKIFSESPRKEDVTTEEIVRRELGCRARAARVHVQCEWVGRNCDEEVKIWDLHSDLACCEVDNSERVPAGWIDGTHRVAPAACNIGEIQDRWTSWICEDLFLELGARLHRYWILMG
jgi:hypothetical protein